MDRKELVAAWRKQSLTNAANEIVFHLKEHGIEITDDEVQRLAGVAVDTYDNDSNRAACWDSAIWKAANTVEP